MNPWSKRKDYLKYATEEEFLETERLRKLASAKMEHNPLPVEEMKKRIQDLDMRTIISAEDLTRREYLLQKSVIYKNQDNNIGPGFSKEFYNELHRFYSQGNRRSGRTHLLARVLVNTAIETGENIYLSDHHYVFNINRSTNHHLLEEVRRVIAMYDKKGLYLNYEEQERNTSIKVSLTGDLLEATRVYNLIKNDYEPLANKEYPLTPDEAFGTRNKKLLLIKI